MRPSPARFWGLTLFVILAVVPMVASLGYASLYSVGLVGLLSQGFTLAHWGAVLASHELWTGLVLTAWITAAVVGISAALGIWLALSLGNRMDRGILAWSIHTPLTVPGTVAALLLFATCSATGWFQRIAVSVGILSAPTDALSLVQDRYGWGIIVAHIFLTAPFLTLMFRGLVKSERIPALMNAAASLGAPKWYRTLRIAAPVLLLRGAPTLALLFVVVFGSYEVPLLLGRQTPQMLSILVMRKYSEFDIAEKPEAMVVALVYTVVVLLFLVWAVKRSPREQFGAS